MTKQFKQTKEEINKIIDLYKSGLTIKQIQEKLQVSEWYVRKPISKIIKQKRFISKLKSKNKEKSVSNSQIQCIYGSLLGDASLTKKKSTFCWQVSHCEKQKELLEHKANILSIKTHKYKKNKNSYSPNSIYYKSTYFNKLFLNKVYNDCFINGNKSITNKWLSKLDWEGIAYWFMDDGCSYKYKNAKTVQVSFSTLSFSENEINLLINKFNNLGVNSHKVKSIYGKKIVLNIDSNSVNYFMDKIEPFIVPCMKYKIKRCDK
jgi:hypothetical protein